MGGELSLLMAVTTLGMEKTNGICNIEWQARRKQESSASKYQCDGGACWRRAKVGGADGEIAD